MSSVQSCVGTNSTQFSCLWTTFRQLYLPFAFYITSAAFGAAMFDHHHGYHLLPTELVLKAESCGSLASIASQGWRKQCDFGQAQSYRYVCLWGGELGAGPPRNILNCMAWVEPINIAINSLTPIQSIY